MRNQNHQNNGQRFQRVPSYDIHPVSIKMLMLGNPWVTLDEYSEKFQPREKFIIALNNRKPFALLLHDPQHKSVRARLWAKEGNLEKQIKSFKTDLVQRIDEAFRLRKSIKLLEQRNNFYLIFGEADKIPGLFVQYLNGEILIQFYTHFWTSYESFIYETIIKKMRDVFDHDLYKTEMWKQMRVDGDLSKEPPKCLDPNMSFRNIEVLEYDVKYKVNIGSQYDTGLYTDMSSVRQKIKHLFTNSKSVLNLFSYTGAFSLFALKNGANDVVSIDLSQKYIDWLEENIALNEDINPDFHTSITGAVKEGLQKLEEDKKKFDLVICDPPSSSSDGNKRTNALKDYENILPAISKVLSEKGKAVIFLNTHKVNKKKFQMKIQEIIDNAKLPLRTSVFYGLSDDCPGMPKFPEGSYLKGLLIEVGTPNAKKAKTAAPRTSKIPTARTSEKPAARPYKKNFSNKKVTRKVIKKDS